MAFVRKKRVDGQEYYQLVENYQENGKVRQRVLAHLGRDPSVEAAIEELERYIENFRGWAARSRAKAQEVREPWEAWRERYLSQYPERREQYGSEVLHPAPDDRRPNSGLRAPLSKYYWHLIDSAEENERRVQQREEKLETLRGLIESGKAKPDPPEVREARERERAEAQRRLRELESDIASLLGRITNTPSSGTTP